MKKLFYKLAAIACMLVLQTAHAQYASQNFTLISQSNPETVISSQGAQYSGCWGWYQDEKKKEYAIACSHRGTYWIDITNPATPTVSAYRAGSKANCIWRETKSYKNYLYVISDDASPNSMQIFDMKYLPDSVHLVYQGDSIFQRGHTLWVEGDKLWVASVTSTSAPFSSMNVYSLANPEKPLLLRRLDQDFPFINHAHDMYVRHDTVYASCGYQGLYVFRYTPAGFTQLGSLSSYPGSGYNHSSALTPDGHTLVFADEVPASLPVKIANVSNLSNIQVLTTVNQFTQTTPHNPFVPDNQHAFVSSYQDGLQLYDISSPATTTLAGYFDTYPQAGGNNNSWPSGGTYNGQWGCYPFFPSGVIFALDRSNGGFILRTALYTAPMINLTASTPSTVCAGNSFSVNVSAAGAAGHTISCANCAIGNPTLLSTTVSFTAGGINTVTITAVNPAYTVVSTHTVNVTKVVAAINVTNTSCVSCNNGALSVAPSGGNAPYSYTWTPGLYTNPGISNIYPGCYTVTVKDAIGCSVTTTACVVVSTVTALRTDENDKLEIFPSPASGILFIRSAKEAQYEVIDALGSVVLSGSAPSNSTQINVSTLPRGVYVVALRSAVRREVKRIILE